MNSPSNFRPATSHVGPATDDLWAIGENPNWRPPVEPQRPRAFCILRLRGCQTLWADSEETASALAAALPGKSIVLRYHESIQQYVPEGAQS